MSNNAHELSNRLLNALDNNYNVVDMHAVNEIISILEKINITKELLETTRLGKHVNELRRKTSEPTLARRAKVLVKRWRDLVIPTAASPHHTGSNRSSAERQMRRLGNTPITSPAFSRQVLSPAVASPRPPSRPAWGGYESDSQDVILVDDDPPPAPAPLPSPLAGTQTPDTPTKRPPSPESPHDDKKAKRDKKPKKRRGHSRAGSGSESPAAAQAPGAWVARNGAPPERKKNGVRRGLDPYAALVNRMPPAGAKKVKTTQELLAQIQSRGGRASPRAAPPADPDVLLVEPADEPSPEKPPSPLRNGGSPPPPAPPLVPLEDEREVYACTCEPAPDAPDAPCPGALDAPCPGAPDALCPAAPRTRVLPAHVHALHHAYLPGINGTRAPLHPHQFAVRKLVDPDRPQLFTSVVPLYNYSDYADDYCVKNMARVPLCTHLPWTEFAPAPPSPPPAPAPPPPRPYPLDEPAPAEDSRTGVDVEMEVDSTPKAEPVVVPEIVSAPALEPSERLKAPLIATEDETLFPLKKCESVKVDVADEFASEQQEHRTVERTKPALDGRALFELCAATNRAVPYRYEHTSAAPTVTLPEAAAEVAPALQTALARAEPATERDALGRPARALHFAEWHECARLGDLVALPYVVID